MANLLTNQTTNTTGTGQAMNGPCTVYAHGTFDGATVELKIAPADSASKYAIASNKHPRDEARFVQPGNALISAVGAYYIRADIKNCGAATSVTVEAIQ